jgi:hypothetical protein
LEYHQVRVPWDSRRYFTVSFETSLFVASYDSQGHGGGIRPRLHTGAIVCQVKVTLRLTVSQQVLVSSPICDGPSRKHRFQSFLLRHVFVAAGTRLSIFSYQQPSIQAPLFWFQPSCNNTIQFNPFTLSLIA